MKKTLLVLLGVIALFALFGFAVNRQEDAVPIIMDDFSETIEQDTTETLLLSEAEDLADGSYAELIDKIRDEYRAVGEQKRLLKESFVAARETGRTFRDEDLELEETDRDTLRLLRREGLGHARTLKRTSGAPWALLLAIREAEDQDEIVSHLESIHGLLRMRKEHLGELTSLFDRANGILSPYLID